MRDVTDPKKIREADRLAFFSGTQIILENEQKERILKHPILISLSIMLAAIIAVAFHLAKDPV